MKMLFDDGDDDFLFDQDDPEDIPDALAWSGKLIVGPKVDKPEDLNRIEEEYRRLGAPVVEFDDDDELPAGT
jgi:hypothetical protein